MCNNYAIRYLSIAIANLLSKGVHRKILHESGIFSLLPHFDDRSVYILYTTYIFIKKKETKKTMGPVPSALALRYCLTYPYLNLRDFQPAQQARFNFDAAASRLGWGHLGCR